MPDFDPGHWNDPDNVFVEIIEEEPLTPVEAASYNRRRALGFLAVVVVVLSLVR